MFSQLMRVVKLKDAKELPAELSIQEIEDINGKKSKVGNADFGKLKSKESNLKNSLVFQSQEKNEINEFQFPDSYSKFEVEFAKQFKE